MNFIRRHSPCEDERSRVRSVDAITVEYCCDIDRKQAVLVNHVVDFGAELARNLEQVTFELLVSFHFGDGFGRRKWLLGVLDTSAWTSSGRHR